MSSKFPSILITGANRGIGLYLLKTIKQSTLKPEVIFATYRDPSKSKELLDLAAVHKDIHVIQLDVGDYDKHELLAKEIAAVSPGGLSLLINNAGIASKGHTVDLLSPDDIRNVMETNLIAPTMLTKALLPELKKATQTTSPVAVINVSSFLGSIGANDMGGYHPYRASKAALNAITKSMSVELKKSKIVFVALHPGWVKTDLGGQQAPLTPEESATGITNVLLGLDESHNGKFISWDGKELPW